MYSTGNGIKDPCERAEVDVIACLTDQQREDLTASAQTFVRYINFRKIHLVLGMEALKPRNRFPPRQHWKNNKDAEGSAEVKKDE